MPPRIRRETPARRDARIRKHLPKAREYWSKWPAYLAEGDLCQAGEKGWGAVAQLTKAVATDRGWQHFGCTLKSAQLPIATIARRTGNPAGIATSRIPAWQFLRDTPGLQGYGIGPRRCKIPDGSPLGTDARRIHRRRIL